MNMRKVVNMRNKKLKKLLDFDKQCIFCKYKYDKDSCFDATYNHNYKCPSISNILHGKIYKLPIIKQIHNHIEDIKFEKEIKSYEEDYISEYETQDMLFIWGIISYDDLFEIVEADRGHLIASTACLGGKLPELILQAHATNSQNPDYGLVKKWLKRMVKCFGEGNFFLEMQPSNQKEQSILEYD